MLYYDKSVDRYEDYLQEHTKNKVNIPHVYK